MTDPILTDSQGRPIPGDPGPLKEGATYKEWRDWVRAKRAWRDRVTDVANRSFSAQFVRSLKKEG
jgi:hypothetical protein